MDSLNHLAHVTLAELILTYCLSPALYVESSNMVELYNVFLPSMKLLVFRESAYKTRNQSIFIRSHKLLREKQLKT